MQPCPDICLIATTIKVRCKIRKFITKNQCRGATVFQDEFELVRDQAPVQWHNHSPDLGDRKIGLEKLSAVHHHDANAVTFLNAKIQEHVGYLISAVIQLFESQTQP